MHVHALMKGVGSMKRYRKEGSERRLTRDAGFANKARERELQTRTSVYGKDGAGREGASLTPRSHHH